MALPTDIERAIREVAGRYKFPDPATLLATVEAESGGNRFAVGDSGNSLGLWQENRYGRGAGIPREQSFDPVTSTERAIREFTAVRKPGMTPGQWAAAAQRPYDREGYARRVDALHGSYSQQPGSNDGVGQGGIRGVGGRTAEGDRGDTGMPAWVKDLVGAPIPPGGATAYGSPEARSAAVDEAANEPAWFQELRTTGQLTDRSTQDLAPPTQRNPVQGVSRGGAAPFVWPVQGERPGAISNPFGAQQIRSAGATVPLPSRNVGADLVGRYGATVVAPVSGTVVETFDAPDERNRNLNHGWGGMTLLRGDDGLMYRMSHAQPGSVGLRPGERVRAGQPVQRIGLSGNTTGPHLDFEIFDRPGHYLDVQDVARGSVAVPDRGGAGRSGAVGAAAAPQWVRDLMGVV